MNQEYFRQFDNLLNTKRLVQRFDVDVHDPTPKNERPTVSVPPNADKAAQEVRQQGGAAIEGAQSAASRLPRLNLTQAESRQLARGLSAAEARGAEIRAEMNEPKAPNLLDRLLARAGSKKAAEAIARYEAWQQKKANAIAAENLKVRPVEPVPEPIKIEYQTEPTPNAPRMEVATGPNGEFTLQAAPVPEPAGEVTVAAKEKTRPAIKRVEGGEKLSPEQYLAALLADPKSVARRAELTRNYLNANSLGWQEAGLELTGVVPTTAVESIDDATLVKGVVALQAKENLPQTDNAAGQDAILGDNTYNTAVAQNLVPKKPVAVASL